MLRYAFGGAAMTSIRPDILRANERIKSASNLISNLGAALLAAASARWFVNGFDLYAGSWILVSIALIWVSMRSLTLLEPEE